MKASAHATVILVVGLVVILQSSTLSKTRSPAQPFIGATAAARRRNSEKR